MKFALRLSLAAMVVGTILWVSRPTTVLHAQSGSEPWTDPVLIFEGRGQVGSPVVVTDAFGQVHGMWVFTTQEGEESQRLIYYTRLDDTNWQPIDVVIPGGNTVGMIGAMAGDGLWLAWEGDQFTHTNLSPLASAQEWETPEGLTRAYASGGLAVATDGALWAVYGMVDTNEIYVQRYDPRLHIWEQPNLVGDPANPGTAPDNLRMAVAPDGSLHVTWTEFRLPNGWPPAGVYYSDSRDGGATWSQRRQMANGNFNQGNLLAGPNNEIYMTWTGIAGTGGKYFQESLDGGNTWGNVVELMPVGTGGGSEGAPNIAQDSAGNLHVVFSNLNCVWYVARLSGSWMAPECISEGTPPGSHIEFPAMALGLGNQLHVMFWTANRELWYTHKVLDAPALDPLVVPVEPTATAEPPTPSPTAAPTRTPYPDLSPAPPATIATIHGMTPLVLGAVSAVALFVMALFARRLQQTARGRR